MHHPHHDGSPLHVSNPYPRLGETVAVRLRVPHGFGEVTSVFLRSNPDREPRFLPATITATIDGWDWWTARLDVENPVQPYRWLVVREGAAPIWVNATGAHPIETPDADDFKLASHPAPPEWLRSSVLYQIFPDRFARSDAAGDRALPDWAIAAEWSDPVDLVQPGRSQQLYGGDLDGVVEHLDHLEQLGVSVVYLTPFFAGRSNHRYDASDFNAVDPLLGGDEALVRLVEAVHARGMRIIGDLTTNHCGSGHEWFRAAYGNPQAPESEFFYWLNDEHTDYVGWLGVPSLPKFNWASKELRRRFIEGPDSVVGRWLRHPFNLDGWRIDVANMTGRYREDDFNAEVRRAVRRTMDEVNPDTILLGESTNDAASDFQGDAWQGAMTYANFTRPVWGWLSRPDSPSSFFGQPVGTIPSYTGGQLLEAHRSFAAGFPWRTRLGNMNALDTHDVPRFATHARPGALPVALGLATTFVGMPVVWAGDEFGLVGEDGEASRTPMPWGRVGEAGEAVHELYRELMPLRAQHLALTEGGIRWLHAEDDVLVYVREHAEESVLCVAARAAYRVTLPACAVAGTTAGADAAERIFGPGTLSAAARGGLEAASDGISFTMWRLPGVAAPDFEPAA